MQSFAQNDTVLAPAVQVDILDVSLCLPSKDAINVYEFVEKSPEFPGGMQELYQFLGENIQFPTMSSEVQIQGKVYVTFVILNTGKIYDIKVIKGIDSVVEREVISALNKMPNWIPGELNGKCVNVRFTLPLHIHYD